MSRLDPRTHYPAAGRRNGKLTLILAFCLGVLPLAAAGTGFGWLFGDNAPARLRAHALGQASAATSSQASEDAGSIAQQAATSAGRAQLCRTWLAAGMDRLAKVRDFEATFFRQERVRGKLLPAETMYLAMRQEPRAAFLRWVDPSEGREVLWHRDQYEGKMLIHECGWRGKMTPVVKLSPNHPLVMRYAQRGIDELGLWSLTALLDRHTQALDAEGVNVEMSQQEIGARKCHCFDISFRDPIEDLGCTQAVIYLDNETKIPLGCELYQRCAESEEPQLLSAYYYEDLKLDAGLDEAKFDPTNPDYHFGSGIAKAKTDVVDELAAEE